MQWTAMTSFTEPHEERPASEDDVVERIAHLLGAQNTRPGEFHIGDDAAISRADKAYRVYSVDVAVAGVHLDLDLFTLEDFGFKAVASALSDVAAMGSVPVGMLLAVVAPPGVDVLSMHQGVKVASDLFGVPVLGGDVSNGQGLSLAVTVIGESDERETVLRNGARAGDLVFVTGALGASAAGLRLRRTGESLENPLVLTHARPTPRFAEGVAAREAGATSMMDLSDGLSLDLHRLADASNAGFALDEVPVIKGATLREALSGGEDYELLFTAPNEDRVRGLFAKRGLRQPFVIGKIVDDVTNRSLKKKPLVREGWQHQL
jgi:thiamine-monophosphate kinase